MYFGASNSTHNLIWKLICTFNFKEIKMMGFFFSSFRNRHNDVILVFIFGSISSLIPRSVLKHKISYLIFLYTSFLQYFVLFKPV